MQPGYEEILREELLFRLAPKVCADLETHTNSGLIALHGGIPSCLARPMIFERQRMENALFIPTGSVKTIARAILRDAMPAITNAEAPWTTHAFTPELQGNRHLALRATSVAAALHDLLKDRFPAVFRRLRSQTQNAQQGTCTTNNACNEFVLQICSTQNGCWVSTNHASRLSSPFPGGIHRMRLDSNAPSRSFLKIEEVFSLMNEIPRQNQNVVDLGAAPGGWSYAFLKRSCRVIAVDNGPLKIVRKYFQNPQLRHLRQDGIGFEPRNMVIPLDWLAADMLIAPGKALGLLKRWLLSGWTRRFIVNIKLPQLHPIAALKPIDDFLAAAPGVDFQIRHLYHDRREATAFGKIKR